MTSTSRTFKLSQKHLEVLDHLACGSRSAAIAYVISDTWADPSKAAAALLTRVTIENKAPPNKSRTSFSFPAKVSHQLDALTEKLGLGVEDVLHLAIEASSGWLSLNSNVKEHHEPPRALHPLRQRADHSR